MNALLSAPALFQASEAITVASVINVLVIDRDDVRAGRIIDAFSWLGHNYRVRHVADLVTVMPLRHRYAYPIVLVGQDAPGDMLATIAALREAMPDGRVLCYTKMSCIDREWPTRLLDCGANMVFDERMSGPRVASMLRGQIGAAIEAALMPGDDAGAMARLESLMSAVRN